MLQMRNLKQSKGLRPQFEVPAFGFGFTH